MGVHKNSLKLALFIILHLLLSCTDKVHEEESEDCSSEVNGLKQQISVLREQLSFQDRTFEKWTNSLLHIQEAIISIETSELYLDEISAEGLSYEDDFLSELMSDIDKVKKELSQREKEISKLSREKAVLNRVISSFRRRVDRQQQRILDLTSSYEKSEENNKTLVLEKEKLVRDIDIKNNIEKNLKNEISALKGRLRVRYLIRISGIEHRIERFKSKDVFLGHTVDKWDVLSSHPKTSYRFFNNGNGCVFLIENEKKFWEQGPFLILKTKKRKLGNQ